MTKKTLAQKGFGLISVIIACALIVAILNVYSFYNPSFSLAKYSPLNYLRAKRDEKRINDLKKLEKAILAYYDEENELPTFDGWCGRISGVIHPDFAVVMKPYFDNGELPFDPQYGNSNQDYFYYRVDHDHYILMTVLELPKVNTKGKYNYSNCHDWPGDDIYNYQIDNIQEE